MTRFVRTLIAVALLGVLTGCMGRSSVIWNYPHAMHETVAESGQEHYRRVSNVAERDRRALADDLDLFFQTERPTRLTKWHVR